MISFPYTKRYFVAFGPTNTAVSPTWLHFRRADTLANVTPQPTITHVANGVYRFDYDWTIDDLSGEVFPDIAWRMSAPTADAGLQYPSGVISAKEFMAAFDVWSWGAGGSLPAMPYGVTIGEKIDGGLGAIGSSADDQWRNTLFGALLHARMDIKGDPRFNNVELPWTTVAGNNIKEVYDLLGDPSSFYFDDPWMNNSVYPVTTVSEMILKAWERANNLQAEIRGFETAGEGRAFGPDLMALSGATLPQNSQNITFDPTINSVKWISENLGGGGGVDLELRAMVQRALGMLHENSVLDNTTYIGVNLASGRLRLYDTAANATAARAASQQVPPVAYDTGKIAEYAINASYTGANLKDYVVTLEWLQPPA